VIGGRFKKKRRAQTRIPGLMLDEAGGRNKSVQSFADADRGDVM